MLSAPRRCGYLEADTATVDRHSEREERAAVLLGNEEPGQLDDVDGVERELQPA
jgi:hypothetical protein